jgi:hypothetical protein
MRDHFRLLVAVLGLLLCLAMANSGRLAAQEYHTTDQWRAKYERESDPVRKSKVLLSLGDAEFKDAEAALADDKTAQALDLVKQYRDQAQSIAKDLNEKFPDAEKHPNGYKQLQISVRGALRRLDAMIVGLAGDERAPFVEIRSQLDEIDHHLMQLLFPKQPGSADKRK